MVNVGKYTSPMDPMGEGVTASNGSLGLGLSVAGGADKQLGTLRGKHQTVAKGSRSSNDLPKKNHDRKWPQEIPIGGGNSNICLCSSLFWGNDPI